VITIGFLPLSLGVKYELRGRIVCRSQPALLRLRNNDRDNRHRNHVMLCFGM
jgi:hypothetical protein